MLISLSGWVAVLLSHLLPLLLATILHVVVNVNVVCTTAVAVAVIVPVMFPLWTHDHNTNFSFACLNITGFET